MKKAEFFAQPKTILAALQACKYSLCPYPKAKESDRLEWEQNHKRVVMELKSILARQTLE